jgi:hypothetical protein
MNMNDMTNTTSRIVKTKPDARAEHVETALEINWEGMERDDLIALAEQTLVIKLQGGWRKNGIPAECKVNATDHKVGVRAPRKPADLAALISKLSPEERNALLAKLTA